MRRRGAAGQRGDDPSGARGWGELGGSATGAQARVDLAAINAGAAIYAAGATASIAEGVEAARGAIADGAGAAALARYVEASRTHAPQEVGR